MGRRLLASAAVLLAALSTLLVSGQAFAQQSKNPQFNQGNGLRVSPVRHDLTIAPGKSQTIDVYVSNITAGDSELKAVINDFTASSDESGQPRVLFDEGDSAPNNGLRKYVSPVPNFTLKPNERKVIKVTVNIPADAAGGGYFGVVRFLPTSVASDKNVSLTASVGSLILVTVPGDIKERMGVESMNVSRGDGKAANFFTNGKGLKAVIRFKNSGNVQLQPFGKFDLKKGGKKIATIEINDTRPRASVLPDSIRRFENDLGDKASSFGKYTLSGNFGYGERGGLVNATTTFYVVPLPFVILAALLVVLILVGIFVLPRMLKGHDRKLARKMRR